ncbi:MAG: ester cyclase [Thermomicrobiales bacterium]
MTVDNATVMQQAMTAIMQEGKAEQVDQFFASDFVGHDTAGKTFTRDDFRMGVLEMLGAFSNRNLQIADQIASGDKIVTRWVVAGRHTGDFRGSPATGRDFQLTGISIDRLAAGKIIESWEVTDDLGLLQQLGLVPGMAAPQPLSAD